MGKLVSGSMMIEGCFGCMMYLSLDKMHLMGSARLIRGRSGSVAQTTRRSLTGPWGA
jgi:hypothetical protein